jgi:antitoxin YefM
VTVRTSFANARAHPAALLERAIDDRETIIISRCGEPDVALIAADELASLQETTHRLRSPPTSSTCWLQIQCSLNDEATPPTIAALQAEVGLADGA